jgi:hypothetical protein
LYPLLCKPSPSSWLVCILFPSWNSFKCSITEYSSSHFWSVNSTLCCYLVLVILSFIWKNIVLSYMNLLKIKFWKLDEV